MKKLCGVLAMTFAFTSIAKNSFAVSSGNGMEAKDIFPFVIGAVLIICVLFIGYKMDKYSENAPIIKKGKKAKNKKAKHSEEITEEKKVEIYAKENKADIPYEADEDEYYDNDNNFDYDNRLNDDTEYEEDDISLFSSIDNNQESSFDDVDDNISYFDSTMVFDSNELNVSKYSEQNTEVAQELDEKISSLDDIDDLDSIDTLEEEKEEQDATNFMNELNRYKEEAEKEDDGFVGFTTKVASKKIEKVEEPVIEDLAEENNVKRYTKKKDDISEQVDIGFLNQMEQNLKRNQEERMRKAGIAPNYEIESKNEEEKTKKKGRKPKKQED